MITKDDILATLDSMGFITEEVEGAGYIFYYGRHKYIYMPDDDDENFVRFAIPWVYDVTDDNREWVQDVVNRVNMHIKYCKMCVWDEDVWNFFEYRLIGNDIDLEELIETMVRVLMAGKRHFNHLINGGSDDGAENDSDDYDNENNDD